MNDSVIENIVKLILLYIDDNIDIGRSLAGK